MPIVITEEFIFPVPPEIFFAFISDPQNMTTFVGYGPVPAIKSVEYLTDERRLAGARYRVHNTDGSVHEEQVTVYDPPRRLCLEIGPFTSGVRFLIHHMEEEWFCSAENQKTKVRRTFTLHPAFVRMAAIVRLIGNTLWRRAMQRNHREIERRLRAKLG